MTMLDTIAHHQHTHGVEDIMLARETSTEAFELRRRFDEDGEEYEDGFQFDDDDEDEDDDELDEEEDAEKDEDDEDADFSYGDEEEEE